MKLTPSPNCCYCEKPHGKSSPRVFQSCDACQAEWDKQSVAASNNLISVSCPRCDLLFSADATPALTPEERKTLEFEVELADYQQRHDLAATLRGLLERTKSDK